MQSCKLQAARLKLQAASCKLQAEAAKLQAASAAAASGGPLRECNHFPAIIPD